MQDPEPHQSVEAVYGGEALTPPHDPRLAALLADQVAGRLTRYWAAIPRGLVRPFSAAYDPSQSPTWVPVYRHLVGQMRGGAYPNLTTYQQGDEFITSDDYLAYLAYEEVEASWVPCYVLGEPASDALRGLRLAPEEAARRDVEERGRDFQQSLLLFEYLQRADIREWNGHPPEPPRD